MYSSIWIICYGSVHIAKETGTYKCMLQHFHLTGPEDRQVSLLCMYTAVYVMWTNMASVQATGPCMSPTMHTFFFLFFQMSTCRQPWNIQWEAEVLTATARNDPSIRELSICDFKAWLMDADLAPCSLSLPFRIYQPRDVSWFTLPPSPLSLPACRAQRHGTLWPVCGPF